MSAKKVVFPRRVTQVKMSVQKRKSLQPKEILKGKAGLEVEIGKMIVIGTRKIEAEIIGKEIGQIVEINREEVIVAEMVNIGDD
jgi:hypothetical protein